jgi:hypothetical protein
VLEAGNEDKGVTIYSEGKLEEVEDVVGLGIDVVEVGNGSGRLRGR